jgi:hypothetical protein
MSHGSSARHLRVLLATAVAAVAGGSATGADLGTAVGVRERAQASSAESQHRIDALSESTEELERAYHDALQQTDALRIYNRQLANLIGSQGEEVASLREQIDRVELVGRQITPLMLKMVDALDEFVELDTPFLLEERRARIANLHELQARADVSEAEKFRRILEAYQIENDYGRTIEAYEDSLELGAETRTVQFLRLGRVALYYQGLDGADAGAWDRDSRAWVELDDEFRAPIRDGLRIARKQTAPDLLRLPVPAAEDAR